MRASQSIDDCGWARVKLAPSRTLPGLTVSFSMPGNSSRVIEAEVTSKLEEMCIRDSYHTDDGREFIGTRVGEYGGHPCAQAVVASSRTEGDKKLSLIHIS